MKAKRTDKWDVSLNRQEFNTILAALRAYSIVLNDNEFIAECVKDTATDGGTPEPTPEYVDLLADILNA